MLGFGVLGFGKGEKTELFLLFVKGNLSVWKRKAEMVCRVDYLGFCCLKFWEGRKN